MAIKPTVEVQGLREFRRDLKRIEPAVAKEMTHEIRAGAVPMLASARSLAPRLSGELSRSTRLSVTTKGVSIYSTLPQAPVLHWGATIEPRGAPITFPRTEFITKPVEAGADHLVESIGDGVERVASRLGWKR
jgi:hypothetical protein